MARLYSQELWYLDGVVPFIYDSGGPAEGFVWIVRDITVNLIGPGTSGPGPSLTFSSKSLENTFWTIPAIFCQTDRTYHWEGRKLINPGDSVQFTHGATLADVCMNGYLLSTP